MGKECELLHLKFNHEGNMGKTKVVLRSDTEIMNSPHPLQEYFFPCHGGRGTLNLWHQKKKVSDTGYVINERASAGVDILFKDPIALQN